MKLVKPDYHDYLVFDHKITRDDLFAADIKAAEEYGYSDQKSEYFPDKVLTITMQSGSMYCGQKYPGTMPISAVSTSK